jgi:cell division protease FtsH
LPDEKQGVAVHESGHALVAAYSKQADPVAKVTILPAGRALGVTEQLPAVERRLYREDYLLDTLAVMLSGAPLRWWSSARARRAPLTTWRRRTSWR